MRSQKIHGYQSTNEGAYHGHTKKTKQNTSDKVWYEGSVTSLSDMTSTYNNRII